MGDHHTHWDEVEEGIELLQVGEQAQAVAALHQVTQRSPQNEYAHYFLGNAYFEGQAYEQALACYVEALNLLPTYLGPKVGAGHTLRLLGDTQRAIRIAQEALKQHPDDADVLYLLGVCYFQIGEHKLADGFLQRFLETQPELEVALEVEGMLQMIRGEAVPLPNT